MSNDAYLRGLLAQQDLTPNEEAALRKLRDTIEEQLRGSLNNIERVYYAGSFGKNTMIRELYDLDIVVYWANDCGFTLQDIEQMFGYVPGVYWFGSSLAHGRSESRCAGCDYWHREDADERPRRPPLAAAQSHFRHGRGQKAAQRIAARVAAPGNHRRWDKIQGLDTAAGYLAISAKVSGQ